ncbi:MAG: SpoIIE family protein phosphatase [Verrucomicrobiota bacterium]|nr:SpoIIE family protein phosphatase [Verrucomicrobiota bacterium]
MWIALSLGLLLVTVLAFVVVYRRQRRQIATLEHARAKIQLEETRVFDFLHGLGTALSDEAKPDDLHRLIVEGALRILEGDSGALYLADRKTGQLRPAFISRNWPPLFEVPVQNSASPEVLHSYLRLHAIAPWDGVIGAVWEDGKDVLLHGEDPKLAFIKKQEFRPASAMVGPLVYGEQKLGLLAVTRHHPEALFLSSDFQIFRAIAEQSAFALYNILIAAEAAEKKRLDQDLQVAHEIQRILLPANAPEVAGYQISGINIPARQVSGDYYDYIPVDAGHCGVAIADVSGKGVSASLIMAMCRSVLRSQAPGEHSAAAVLQQVNAQLYPDIREDMFISMAYAILGKDSASLTLCRAGHDAPLLYSARTRAISRINPPGMALGIDSGGVFNRVTGDFSMTLEPDDCLILYTDGVTEALDRHGEEFGMENVIKSILVSAPDGAAAIITRLTDDLRAFVGTQPQTDDITLIAIRKKNEQPDYRRDARP